MSNLKYFNSLNLFEGLITELEQGNEVQELGAKLSQAFQSNPPLLRAVMNRLRSYPKDMQREKIGVALRALTNVLEHEPFEVSQAIFRALDMDDKSKGYVQKFAGDDVPPRDAPDRRENRKEYVPKPWIK